MDARAARRSVIQRDRHPHQEVVGRQLPQAFRDHPQKKSFVASERDEGQREQYLDEVTLKKTKTLVFVDETSAYVGQSREYGWAARDERVYDIRPKGKKERVSLVAAASLDGAMAEQALVITDSVNKNAFLSFLATTLLPTLAKGSVVVMDNWTVHHGEEVRELALAYGCELLYLLTYSPELNPIEHLFAKIKAFVKGLRPESSDKLVDAFCSAVKSITPKDVYNSFRHCGYHLGQ